MPIPATMVKTKLKRRTGEQNTPIRCSLCRGDLDVTSCFEVLEKQMTSHGSSCVNVNLLLANVTMEVQT
ncbi:hypothetical protein J5N97_000009 [Dioscorea zingiberensis]|uniref:Uncharacterized protein n=1 Tax=Dioscorea zingiberensis TaxID=325984 RepID=A0A9D5BW50_9LILI|nr:hypothetical protein J5N97_000009 [Dioscorea zingiberensis]